MIKIEILLDDSTKFRSRLVDAFVESGDIFAVVADDDTEFMGEIITITYIKEEE